jgi:hypothetical protein
MKICVQQLFEIVEHFPYQFLWTEIIYDSMWKYKYKASPDKDTKYGVSKLHCSRTQ